MNIHESGEMYLENILRLREKQAHTRSIDIVNQTGYSKPSISRALRQLRNEGMIIVDEDGYITLTVAGEARAHKVYERHRILMKYFESIGVSSETADADACRIEHVISDETFEKLKALVETDSE
nr:metal-dependent transcriptional regulator [Clostridia bacterium]